MPGCSGCEGGDLCGFYGELPVVAGGDGGSVLAREAGRDMLILRERQDPWGEKETGFWEAHKRWYGLFSVMAIHRIVHRSTSIGIWLIDWHIGKNSHK